MSRPWPYCSPGALKKPMLAIMHGVHKSQAKVAAYTARQQQTERQPRRQRGRVLERKMHMKK